MYLTHAQPRLMQWKHKHEGVCTCALCKLKGTFLETVTKTCLYFIFESCFYLLIDGRYV